MRHVEYLLLGPYGVAYPLAAYLSIGQSITVKQGLVTFKQQIHTLLAPGADVNLGGPQQLTQLIELGAGIEQTAGIAERYQGHAVVPTVIHREGVEEGLEG